MDEYIPAAHVKFLEQAGIKVVPVSYKLQNPALTKLLDTINGLYVPGDSLKTLTNSQFLDTFSNIVDYVKNKNS